jgi:hypothetical protein
MSSSLVRNRLLVALLLAVLAVSILAVNAVYSLSDHEAYVGVAFGGTTTTQAKELIDKVKGYTNLFVLATGRNPISYNESAVYDICDYAVANDLSVILNFGIKDPIDTKSNTWFWHRPNLGDMKSNFTQRWGDKFLGVYYNDEPGGIQLDGNWKKWFSDFGERLGHINNSAAVAMNNIYLKMLHYVDNGTKPEDYDLETQFFIQNVLKEDPGLSALKTSGIPTFTSDYCLYWFDYLGGYDTMFAELGWNTSVTEQIALVKGAARMQDKDWGAIVTWKYMQPPYLDTGQTIYNQMKQAYNAGAKYIVIFDFPYNNTANPYGSLTSDHFQALQTFWNKVIPQPPTTQNPQVALVLPKDFGWGMRHPNDTVWGFWTTDYRTQQVAIVTSDLLGQYGIGLDIVYDDPAFPIADVGYRQVYYWNSTKI